MSKDSMIRADIEARLVYMRVMHRETLQKVGHHYEDELEFLQLHGTNADVCIRLAAILLEYAVDLRTATPKPLENEAH